jgi:DNA-binding IscR family transcriptional regulator
MEQQGNVKAIYKAEIIEYDNGNTDILYECDVKRNKQCNKHNCCVEACTHTLDKQYAKNFK